MVRRLRVHDRKVRNLARRYEKEGWYVRAATSGFKRPRKIKGLYPDIIATNDEKIRVREIKVYKPAKGDRKQIRAFKRYAKENPGIDFRMIIARRMK